MTFNLTINVTARNVNDTLIGVGRVGLNVARQVSQAPVKVNQMNLSMLLGIPLTIPDLVLLRFAIAIDASDYTIERAVVSFDDRLQAWQTSNPHVIPTGSKSNVGIDARLGVVRFAPIKTLPETMTVTADFNPGSALLELHGNALAYRGLWLEDTYVACLSDPIPGDPDAVDWGRFAHEKKHLQAKDFGTFTLLEFGFPAPNTTGRPRFLVGVWYPNQALGDIADVNVFFSPNTGQPYPGDSYPFAKAYPYQTTPKAGLKGPKYNPPDLNQQYVDLALGYVCTGYKMVYQMLAAGKNSIIVMPIQPASQWGPLETRTCMWRLVLEVVRFGEALGLIARQGKVGQLNLMREGATVDANSSGVAGVPFAHTDYRLTTSAFSAGLRAMLRLMGAAKLTDEKGSSQKADKDYPPSHFAARDDECQAAWKSLWDIDGGFRQLGGFEACMRPMLAWRKQGSNRSLRMYHSEDTVDSTSSVSDPVHPATSIADLAPDVVVHRKQGRVGFIDQSYSPDRSILWVLFSNSSLRKKSPPDDAIGVWPSLGIDGSDAHHMVPTVAFGHAWRVS